MNCLAARLPFTNRAGFDFREERGKLEVAKRRTAFLAADRAFERFVPLRFRRRGPPPSEILNMGGGG